MVSFIQSLLPYAGILIKCVVYVLIIFGIPIGLAYLVWRCWRWWEKRRA